MGYFPLEGMVNDTSSIYRMNSVQKHSPIEKRYFGENLDTKAHWIYEPDESLPYHRILVHSNFCSGSRGYWIETSVERVRMFSEEKNTGIRFVNEYAYPLNTIGK